MRWAILGIGNPLRQDDGVGRVLVQRLRERHPAWPLLEASGETAQLLDLFQNLETVLILDAAVGTGIPGTVQLHDVKLSPLKAGKAPTSSHGMGLAEAIELARVLTMLPSNAWVLTIEAQAFEHGEELTDAVASSLADAISTIDDWVRQLALLPAPEAHDLHA